MLHSAEFKEAAVQKLMRPGQDLKPLARQIGVNPGTLRKWRDSYGNGDKMGRTPGSKGHTAEQKLRAILETATMDENALGEYCRRNGTYASQLEQWREQCLASMRKGPLVDPVKRSLETENRLLKKELHRKEKALAETAEKAHEYWGSDEGDEVI